MKITSVILVILNLISVCYGQNCSYNGVWNGNNCDCDLGWTGSDCSELILLPANPNNGYRPDNTDAWGASILKDDVGIYHMWVSVVENNCDIQYWARNSKIIHAISSSPQGPYTYEGEAFPVMAHEADVRRGPGNNWVAFLTAGVDDNGDLAYSNYGVPCDCDPLTQEPTASCTTGASTEATVICTASSPYGPWSDPIVILKPDTLLDGIDANFSAVVHNDGNLVGLWRTYPSGSQVHWVTATNYLDPTTYTWQDQETSLFPPPYDGYTSEGLEDMFVYYDENRDVYHAIFHDMVALGGASFYDGLGHAYSTDGINWTYTGEAADNTVNFTDETTTTSARARPHFLIEEGQITHLITAEQFNDNDWSYTLIEPIGNSVGMEIEDNLSRKKSIKVYPNPSTGKISVTSTNTINEITVYTLLGEKIKNIDIINSSVADFEITTKGFFLLEIMSDNTYNYEKIIIE